MGLRPPSEEEREVARAQCEDVPDTVDRYTICQTLRRAYRASLDPRVREIIVDAVCMAKRMDAKLQGKSSEWTEGRKGARLMKPNYGANIYHPIEVEIIEAKGAKVWDVEGKMYLDFLAGYSALSHGHRHPKIIEAAKAQMDKVTLTSRAFLNPVQVSWELKVCRAFDSRMVLPMNSGAEGVETAIKIARKWGMVRKGVKDGDQQIVVCDGNFHGRTTTVVSFSPNSKFREGFGPLTPGFISCPFADAGALGAILSNNPNVVAFLVEPVQGEGGMNIPPKGYLHKVREICTEKNVLLILDEVQTGLGRTGYLLAEEHDGIKADLTILGKALGGGIIPISCVLDRRGGIMDVLGPGDHGSTFGGNPLACAVSMAAIDVLYEDQLIENSKIMGSYLLAELKRMGLNARGRGLMIGIEVEAGTSRRACEELAKKGILVKDTQERVIRVTPPLCITKPEIDHFLEKVEEVLRRN